MKKGIQSTSKKHRSDHAILRTSGATVKGKNLLIRFLLLLTCFSFPVFSQEHESSADKAQGKVKLTHPEVPRMPAKELLQNLKKSADIVLVDTQSGDGYEMWHIPSAINITFDSTADPTTRQLMLRALPMDKQIVIYCLCEEGTDSAKMALELRQLGYSKESVKVLEGGLVLWDEKGYPMVKQKVAE
jgi:rhodanese-related sulfurtransferase